MTQNTEHFKKLLKNEFNLLVSELKSIGRINPDNIKDWEAVPPDLEITKAEHEELAEKMEVYEENTAILKQLEIKYNEVRDALQRIKDGVYGKCEVCHKEIEDERLEANPAAKTCKAHI